MNGSTDTTVTPAPPGRSMASVAYDDAVNGAVANSVSHQADAKRFIGSRILVITATPQERGVIVGLQHKFSR